VQRSLGYAPNENAHQLRAIMVAPAQTYVSLAAPPEGAARAAPRATPARRLHARVRRQPSDVLGSNARWRCSPKLYPPVPGPNVSHDLLKRARLDHAPPLHLNRTVCRGQACGFLLETSGIRVAQPNKTIELPDRPSLVEQPSEVDPRVRSPS
jgi:hypothetical protein